MNALRFNFGLSVALIGGGCDHACATREQITKVRVEDWTHYFRIYHTDHPVPASSMEKVLFGARARIQMSMSPKDRTALSPATLEEALADGWGRKLRFSYPAVEKLTVVVESAGRDGRFGTEDDIASRLELTPVKFAQR
jgi:hypothetical protein